MSQKPFYITTTLPYVNAEPHIGHAMEFIRADIIARTKKLAGYDVFFNTGTDEHGIKIYQKAQQLGLDPQVYVDQAAEKFKTILPLLGMMPEIVFTRTTGPHHVSAVQTFWEIIDKNGFIYKKNYSVKYCVGCELEKTESELVDGRCPLHPAQDLEIIDEENYFFKFSAFQQPLLDLYAQNPNLVIPDFRFNEIKAFVARGLTDFSISRLAHKMPWGTPVPGDDKHVMYVWFDALVNYISTLGWPEDTKKFEAFWKNGTPIQYCGKDNLRQQSAMWQAMLLAAKMPPTHSIIINGFVTGEGGIKMSKSLGNTVDPLDIVKEYGTDALRYYVARELSPFEDSPFTMEKFKEAYNAHLANGIGNLTSRIMRMATTNLTSAPEVSDKTIPDAFLEAVSTFNLQAASNIVWEHVSAADRIIQEKEPFKLIKTDKEKGIEIIKDLCVRLCAIANMLEPIMPQTSELIKKLVKENKMPDAPLFVRK